MDEWLSEQGKDKRVLDLGSGTGSFDYSRYVCRIVAVDSDPHPLSSISATRPSIWVVNSRSHQLPFTDQSFSLIICANALEHFPQVAETLTEIGRILEPHGSLIVVIPDGFGFDDGLYRFLSGGADHVNRFSFNQIVDLIEKSSAIRLVKWHELFSSYSYLTKSDRKMFALPPRNSRKLDRLPKFVFFIAQFTLNVLVRFVGRWVKREVALYGWALYFRRSNKPLTRIPASINVCMRCGSSHVAQSLDDFRLAKVLYRCPSCKQINPYFKPWRSTV